MMQQKLRVLLVYTGMIPSVEISALRPLALLARQGRIKLKHTTVFEEDDEKHLFWCDVVVCCRCCMASELEFLKKVQLLNIPYVYDLDDNFIRLAEMDLPNIEYLRWAGSRQTVRNYARNAALVKVGSLQLKEDLAPYTDRCVIQPYAFDFSIIKDVKPERKNKDCVMVAFAGSIGHIVDLKMVIDALRWMLERYRGKVKMVFYGAFVAGLEEFSGAVSFVPFREDYPSFIRDFMQRGFDVAIAPLMDNLSNRSKTNNKYREYAACRVAGIYSDMPVYSACVTSGENGMLAAYNADSWKECLAALIDSPELRAKIVENAYSDVSRNNTLESAAKRWDEELLRPILKETVSYSERESVLRQQRWKGRRLMRSWLVEGETNPLVKASIMLRYFARASYTDLREALKSFLKKFGLFEPCKRLKHLLFYRKYEG